MSAANLSFVGSHGPGMSGIGYALHEGALSLLSAGQDGQICVRNTSDPSKITLTAQAKGASGHCLAVSNVTNQFAVGDQEHFVRVGHRQTTRASHQTLTCLV